jgi:sporulation protein YlmC with PRC-barrel domain
LGSSGRYNWTVIANDGKANSTNYYFYFNLTNFSVSCEAGGNYQQGALVLVQGTIKNESIVVPSYSINLSIYDSGNNRDAYQNLTTANDGGFETNFANLSVGSYVLNATAVYRGYNETCQDIFSIGGPASLILDKIVTLQNITNETITYNISLRVTNKGMSDASSVVLTDSDSTDSPYNIENVFANSSFIRSYLKEYIRNSSTYDLAFGIASVNAINSYSGNEISSNSSEITLTVPALEIGQQLNLIKNIYYNSENSTSVNYTVSINVINSGGVDLSSISLIDSDLGLTFTINLNRTQNYSYTSSVVVDKAASNSNKLFVKTSATVNSITYQSNQIQVRIPGYGGPADAIVNAPASISASSSFSTIISVENKNADVGQDFTIDYWITNAKNDDINYSSGQQTIYVAASGSSDLTAVLTSPSTAGNYRFKALVSWAGGTATAYDSFLVASMGTGDGDEGGGSGGNGGGGIGGGSSSSVVAGSITGKITDSVVCNPPYIRYGKECCLDKNNNSICDSDDAEEVQNQTNATSAEGKNENIKTSENNSEQFDNQIVKNFFSGASNLLSKTSNSLFSNNYLLLFLLVALIFIVFIVLFIKFNLINSLIVFYNFIINKSIYRIKDIFYIFKIKQKDPTRLTNILGMDVYSSDGDLIGKVKEVYLENNHPKVYGWLIKVDKKVAKKIGKKFILVKHHLVISIKHVMMVDGRVLEYLENY